MSKPQKVVQAILSGNRSELSNLGKRGSTSRRTRERQRREAEFHATGVLDTLQEANEHICPID